MNCFAIKELFTHIMEVSGVNKEDLGQLKSEHLIIQVGGKQCFIYLYIFVFFFIFLLGY